VRDFGQKVEGKFNEARPRVDHPSDKDPSPGTPAGEVKRVIAYLNDEVVPEVRQGSSRALRAAAAQLEKLAEHLDSGSNRTGDR
jgi:hypothetical protein